MKVVTTNLRANRGAVALMLLAVGIQATAAILLKTIADGYEAWGLLLIAAGVGGIIALNLGRLLVWGLAYRRYPLSSTFPLSALFFPVVLLIAVGFGDPVGTREVAGAGLITVGVFWLTSQVEAAE